MSQYPDEDDEYELQYQEELEMLDEFPPDPEEIFGTKSTQSHPNRPITLPSPQLSQISYGQDDSATTSQAGALVNRRLFGTPKGPQRGASTPLASKQYTAPLQEVVEIHTEDALDLELQSVGLRNNKRRLQKDLFKDIYGLYGDDTYEDPIAKKARTDEERDLEAIAKILESRQRLRDTNKSLQKDNLSRLQLVHAFKMKNLSNLIPQWPSLTICRSDKYRIYVRFHSDAYETNAINETRSFSKCTTLLGESKQQVWRDANEIVLHRTSIADTQPVASNGNAEIVVHETEHPEMLWVEKYKPRKYIDLLSDEMTNRSLLFWLKMWDKVVFGREFKTKVNGVKEGELNSFNKRTGKFESNGGWRQRKIRQMLNTEVDELGRPMQKVALLCGPPGLGKTTLAHTIARHAGYEIREINASDDRSPEAFKLALENGTQMTTVMTEQRRPNCIILDEIDGAPRQSIEYLVKFVSDSAFSKVRAKGGKAKPQILRRPIICICNDLYDVALRPLRSIAFIVNFPPIESARLAERLVVIARKEHLKADFGSLIALAEKSGNDVRCCISTLQFFNAQKKALTLHDVLNKNLGQKDHHQGLFDVWSAIFKIQRPRKKLDTGGNEHSLVTMTDMSVPTRVHNVLDVVHAGGDYERLMQGVYENYLQQKMPDPDLNGVVEALHWFCFSDVVQRQLNQMQNYVIYPYLQFGFVAWHLLFASLAWPRINFPTRGFEFNQKRLAHKSTFQSFRKGIVAASAGATAMLMDIVPLVKRIMSPHLRSVAVQLLSQRERYDLKHTVDVMVDLGLTYTQVKSADGHYVFQMEPDLETLVQFPGYPGLTLNYFSRQLIAHEVELECIRRAVPKNLPTTEVAKPKSTPAATKTVPNHLQTFQLKRVNKNVNVAKEAVSKDFFGRIQHKTAATIIEEAKPDPIVKSPIWYRYKEGFNNAVRKDVHMNELL